jgi:serine/threonine protein phosphatase PrpC
MSDSESEPIVVSAAALTDAGKVRSNNEDFVAYRVPEQTTREAAYGSLFLVCDGVGGGVSGEVASELAGRRILNEYYCSPVEQPPAARLLDAVRQANLEVYQKNREQPEGRRMTTTVVAAVVVGSRLFLAHTGDSRAYLISAGQITPVTRDHSWVAELVRSGDLTPAEAELHPWRNRITRALGMKESAEVEEKTLALAQCDIILLCSDGLTRHVEEAEILEAVTRHAPSAAAQQLVDLTNQRGGLDNVSVVIAALLPAEVAVEHELAEQHREQQGAQPVRGNGP